MSSKFKGSNSLIMMIGLLTSLLIIQFTGPYLATLKSNPFLGTDLAKPFGYFQATVLEVLFAFLLVMCHSLDLKAASKFWMVILAGLILMVATTNAMMEDLTPHIQKLSTSNAKFQEANLKMEEANRQIQFMTDLGITKNPVNAIRTNAKITALKMEASALQRDAFANLPWLEVIQNFFLKLVVVLSNATIFWILGIRISAKQLAEQIIATDCNGVAIKQLSVATEQETIATDCNGVAIEQPSVATEQGAIAQDCNVVAMEECSKLTDQVKGLQQQLTDTQNDLTEKQDQITELQKDIQNSKQEISQELQETKEALNTLQRESLLLQEQFAEVKLFDARRLTKKFYEDFCKRHQLSNLSEIAQMITKRTLKRTDNTDLSKATKGAWILNNMNLIDQEAA